MILKFVYTVQNYYGKGNDKFPVEKNIWSNIYQLHGSTILSLELHPFKIINGKNIDRESTIT